MDESEKAARSDSEQAYRWMLDFRGIKEPCMRCGGAGRRAYGSTSTWRGGIGGAAITEDVCDACWGTGDDARHGVNLRALEVTRRDWEAAQCAHWLAKRIGAKLQTQVENLRALADVIEAESRRSKVPEGVAHAFWYKRSAESLANVIRELTGANHDR